MSIPASNIVQVNPAVVAANGNPLALNGLFLTENTQMPTGTVLAFTSAAAVSNFFGPSSAEYTQALIYFGGYIGSSVIPGQMLFAAFNLAARAAFLTSGSLAGLTLTQLQAFDGTLTLTINGTTETSSTINLAGATSFSNAATLIQAGFTGTVPVVTYNAVTSAFVFTSPTTGAASTITFATGTIAADLNLTSATGAYLSQGAVLDTPNTAMNNAVASTQNFVSFVTLWEPTVSDKVNFAIWSNGQNNRYLYLAWDTDAQAIVQNSTECFGAVALAAAYNGVAAISGNAADVAVQVAAGTAPVGTTLAIAALATATFVAGTIASINFSQTNGRITLAFRSQGGLISTCTDTTSSATLLANGYSFYGTYATANQNFTFFYNGNMPGEFDWIDTFINQVFMNSQFQLDDMTLLTQVGFVPYDPAGYALLRASKQDTINTMLNFGGIATGVVLSSAQIAEINQAAGVNAASVIQTNGYYLQILDPGATVRAARGTPVQNFWYADGGSVQRLVLASIEVQ